ncbi:hypothetical protein [Clostridium sp. BJN0013]|uniref:hypothetical protein n=1 Tax=Clostridium sp. BJN0013 TaxID=3236840 RepID=UPI0034C5CF3F
MPRMTDMDINFISLVKKGANKQKIQIYKSDDYMPETNDSNDEVKGFFNVVKSFFTGKNIVQKADKPKPPTDFAGAIAAQDVSDNLDNARWTLRTVMYNILADDTITDKKSQIGTQIDSFKNYVLNQLDQVGIKKCADQLKGEPIEKAGKKISTARLDNIKGAITALQLVVDEVSTETEGGDGEVKKEDVTEIMKSALNESLKPITERLDKIEKEDSTTCPSCKAAVKPEDKFCSSCGKALNAAATSTKKEDTEDTSEIIKAVIEDALKPVNERIEAVEKSRGISKQAESGSDEITVKKENVFAGLDI